MRSGSLLVIAGLLLIVGGVAQSWYYAPAFFPAQEARSEHLRLSFRVPAPCPSLAPAQNQGRCFEGGTFAAMGAILVLLGGLRFVLAAISPLPARAAEESIRTIWVLEKPRVCKPRVAPTNRDL